MCVAHGTGSSTDHLSGAKEAKKVLGGTIAIGDHVPGVQKVFKSIFDLNITCDGSQFDRLFKDGDEFKIGDLPVKVLSTPGHTPACVTYVVNDEAVFVGDTIFAEVSSCVCVFVCVVELIKILNLLIALLFKRFIPVFMYVRLLA